MAIFILRKLLNVLTILIITFLLLELIFFILPVSDASIFQEVNNRNKIAKYEANKTLNKQSGYQFDKTIKKKTNNLGFFSDYDYEEVDRGLFTAIIGDSFVEAANVPNKNTLSGILSKKHENKFLPFAVNGSPLSQYLAVAKWVEENYNPKNYIFVIIENDFEESYLNFNKRKGFHYFDNNFKLKRINYKISFLKKILSKSSFFRYLYIDYKILPRIKDILNINADINLSSHQLKEEKKVVEKIIRTFHIELNKIIKNKKILFVLDSDREAIYTANKNPKWTSKTKNYYELFKKNSTLYDGSAILDMNNYFKNDYKENRQKFNFVNDWHWNNYGHYFVAKKIIENF